MKHNLILGIQSQRSIRLVIVKHVTIRINCGTELMWNGYRDKKWDKISNRTDIGIKCVILMSFPPHFCVSVVFI
jgi:hypothetical protein